MRSDQEIRAWLDGFAACVRQCDTRRGRQYFHQQVYCFGSYMSACRSLEALVRRQWKRIWPYIAQFRFRMNQLQCRISADGRWACAIVLWHSVGYRRGGKPFRRDGRMTVLLTHRHRQEPWRAFHTHYSLIPGTPQTVTRRG